jgi:DNA repair protein RadA/Sms
MIILMKTKTIFSCQQCGYQSPKWLGKCPDCGQWNSLVEERIQPTPAKGRGPAGLTRSQPAKFNEIILTQDDRFSTHLNELDRVLGGGVVAGSVVLIGGDPGIGKSTLVLQALQQISRHGGKVLYVTGEESLQQVKLRGERLGTDSDNLFILAETALEAILETAQSLQPRVVVIDSVQTMFSSQLPSAPGSIGQVREVAGQLMMFAKRTNTATFLIGHVTKEGAIAGPRVLEHIVDTVLYFEGDRGRSYRVLRAVKNRFGSTNEIGVFEMKGLGLEGVENPSELFLSERPMQVNGSVVVSSLEGTRPLLVELQALVCPSNLAMPRRMAIGVDAGRVSLLLAVLERRGGLHLQGQDVFVNVVGGLGLEEPAVDLGIVAAVASSFKERPIDPKTLVVGEVGLGGEIRRVHQPDMRLREAARMGFRRCILPDRNLERLTDRHGLELIGVNHLREALGALMS